MAEYILMRIAAEDGKKLNIASAGLFAGNGSPINDKSAEILQKYYSDSNETEPFIKGHSSRQLTESMVEEADHILAMTKDHAEYLAEIYPEHAAKFTALGEYSKDLPEPWGSRLDVLDPFGSPLNVYDETYEQLKLLLEAWYGSHVKENKHEEDEL